MSQSLVRIADGIDAQRHPGESQPLPQPREHDNLLCVDIGPGTIAEYQRAIRDAHTVVWNGPMGVFEVPVFATGTNAVAEAVASVKGTTIIGGGDSIAAVKKAGLSDRITHISTGGGASLEFLGGQVLPGVAALTEK